MLDSIVYSFTAIVKGSDVCCITGPPIKGLPVEESGSISGQFSYNSGVSSSSAEISTFTVGSTHINITMENAYANIVNIDGPTLDGLLTISGSLPDYGAQIQLLFVGSPSLVGCQVDCYIGMPRPGILPNSLDLVHWFPSFVEIRSGSEFGFPFSGSLRDSTYLNAQIVSLNQGQPEQIEHMPEPATWLTLMSGMLIWALIKKVKRIWR